MSAEVIRFPPQLRVIVTPEIERVIDRTATMIGACHRMEEAALASDDAAFAQARAEFWAAKGGEA